MAMQLRVEPAGWCVPMAPGQSLLEASLRAGVRLPSSCRNGTCRTCMCRLLSGEVGYRIEWPGLLAEEKQEGWILPCVALPHGDVVIAAPLATHDFAK
ncbi:MAG: 2Fe-2S iron-sulfur cluster binding domain-containing protein [Ideonella sp.]|jgi:ferredoxin|nr:2Fe-2S iron-sulfur cluster binding domain-containing protein [Ideonella sp.]MBL0148303.1 2Fe-2S iron-sulfur cluster binding domain-containing protein [Ideonella sp.]